LRQLLALKRFPGHDTIRVCFGGGGRFQFAEPVSAGELITTTPATSMLSHLALIGAIDSSAKKGKGVRKDALS